MAKSVRSGCWSYLEIAESGSHGREYKKVGSPNQELGPVWLVLDSLRGYRAADVGMTGHHLRGLLRGWFWSCQKNRVAEATLSSVTGAMLMVIGKIHNFSSLSSSQSPWQVAMNLPGNHGSGECGIRGSHTLPTSAITEYLRVSLMLRRISWSSAQMPLIER